MIEGSGDDRSEDGASDKEREDAAREQAAQEGRLAQTEEEESGEI